jgi:hypothetical protein
MVLEIVENLSIVVAVGLFSVALSWSMTRRARLGRTPRRDRRRRRHRGRLRRRRSRFERCCCCCSIRRDRRGVAFFFSASGVLDISMPKMSSGCSM